MDECNGAYVINPGESPTFQEKQNREKKIFFFAKIPERGGGKETWPRDLPS